MKLPKIPYVREFTPAYGEAVEVSPTLRRLTAENPSPFTYYGTNAYIAGRGAVAIIDPGPDLDSHLEALLKAVDGERVAAILLTHTHIDHWPLTPRLAAALNAPVYALTTPGHACVPDHQIQEGDVWTLGGATLRAVATPGHAVNHICFEIEEDHSLICGDHVMGWSTTVIPPDGSLRDYIASLKKLQALAFSRLFPAHGAPIDDPAPFVDAYLAHRLYRDEQVRSALAAAGEASATELVDKVYTGLDGGVKTAAAWSLLSHLVMMVEDGAARVDGDKTIEARFRAAG